MKNYCVVEYINGNGFEDDEGVSILNVELFGVKSEGEEYLRKKIGEVKEMMNNSLVMVDKVDYKGVEGEGYFEEGEFVYKMESEGGFVLKKIN